MIERVSAGIVPLVHLGGGDSVASRLTCPRCGGRKTWRLRRGGRRCARCRFEWRPGRWPLRLTAAEWRRLLQWFVRGVSSAAIARETRLDRKRVLRALAVARARIASAAPLPIRSLGGGRPLQVTANGHGAAAGRPGARPTRRTAMVGIYATHGLVWAEVVRAADAPAVRERLLDRADRHEGRHSCPRYAAIVHRGSLHRLAPEPGIQPSSASFGLVESFWAFALGQLGARGGIRLARLDLYLAECAWRYNHRRETSAERLRGLLALTRYAGRASGTLPRRAGAPLVVDYPDGEGPLLSDY